MNLYSTSTRFERFAVFSALFLLLSSCTSDAVLTNEQKPVVLEQGVLCMDYDGGTFNSSEFEDMKFYEYTKLNHEEFWYSALGTRFQYQGSDTIYERKDADSLLFTFQNQAECVVESMDNFSTEISLMTAEEAADWKSRLLMDGALPEEVVVYAGKSYQHVRGFNFGNGIADFYFKEQGEKTYILTFTWLHEGEAGLSRDEITKARGEDPLPGEYQTILETLELL